MKEGSKAKTDWQRFTDQLRTHLQDERRCWGNVEDAVVARFLAGGCTDAERALVESAIQQHADLREAISLVRQIVPEGGFVPASQSVQTPGGSSSRGASQPLREASPLFVRLCRHLIPRLFSADPGEMATYRLFGESALGELLLGQRQARGAPQGAFGLGERDGEYADLQWLALADEVRATCSADWADLEAAPPPAILRLAQTLASRLKARGLPSTTADTAAKEFRAFFQIDE